MKYIMVTDWHDHWDKCPGGRSFYTTSMLVPPMHPSLAKSGVATTFLRFGPRRKPQKAWSGKVADVRYTPELKRVGFLVKLAREVRFPRKYTDLADGWYLDATDPADSSHGLW